MHKKKSSAERLAQLEKDSKRIDKVINVLVKEVRHLQEYATELHQYLESQGQPPNIKIAFAETNEDMNRVRADLEKSRIARKEHEKYVS
jgi:predicted nuclease with TOPRIM domain